MIVRHLVVCQTCNAPHTLRMQVGHENYQEHSFECTGCGERMVVGMHCDQKNVSLEIVEKDNCKQGTIEGEIVNLSPDFPIQAAELHADLAFPSIGHLQNIVAAQQALGIAPIPAGEYLKRGVDLSRRPNNLWPILEKAWSLGVRGRHDLAKQKIDEYFNEPGTTKSLEDALFDFCLRMLTKGRIALFSDAADFAKKVYDEHTPQFNGLQRHHKQHFREENFERYRETFREYFSNFTDFSQTLMHAQLDINIPPTFEASSSAFSRTKLFYGNAFENLTTNVATLACMNNVAMGRRFDEFQTMTLKKYLTIDKANRCNPFKDEPTLMNIGKCLDSTIRNASHHGGMKLVNNGRQIQYRSGGNGAQRVMSYLDYIKASNEIVLSTCALFALELAVMQDV